MSGKHAWLAAPVVFALLLVALLVTWAVMEPATLVANFDADGRSPFELATLPVFAAIVPMVWLCNPFGGSRRRRVVLCLMVSVVALMAIVKELDLHYTALHWLYPDFVQETGGLVPGKLVKPSGSPLTGTPFKMRVLTNGAVPLGMKAAILFYFVSFFGTFAAGFAYLGIPWAKGVFRLDPACWAWGCLGASGVLVQVADRLPAWLDHRFGLDKSAAGGASAASSLCTCLEEGGEMMIAVFALLTIHLAWRARKRGSGEP
ncbi:MAG: hypothetical protein ACI4R9_07440 [Kiritimatiellia bacterium]